MELLVHDEGVRDHSAHGPRLGYGPRDFQRSRFSSGHYSSDIDQVQVAPASPIPYSADYWVISRIQSRYVRGLLVTVRINQTRLLTQGVKRNILSALESGLAPPADTILCMGTIKAPGIYVTPAAPARRTRAVVAEFERNTVESASRRREDNRLG